MEMFYFLKFNMSVQDHASMVERCFSWIIDIVSQCLDIIFFFVCVLKVDRQISDTSLPSYKDTNANTHIGLKSYPMSFLKIHYFWKLTQGSHREFIYPKQTSEPAIENVNSCWTTQGQVLAP